MATVTYKKGKLYDLPIIDLKPNPNQPRNSLPMHPYLLKADQERIISALT